MDFENISAGEINAQLIDEQKTDLVGAANLCRVACEAYRKDVEARESNLTKQAAAFTASLEKAKGQRKQLAAKVADYTSRGKIDEAAKVDTKVEALDREIAALERKLRLVKSAEVKGDKALYDAAQEAYQAVETEKARYIGNLNQLRDITNAEIARLQKVVEAITNCTRYDQTGAVYGVFQKVDRHYRDLDRIEREAQERWQAEQKAAAEAHKGTHYRLTGDSAPTQTVDPEVVAAREKRERETRERAAAITKQNNAANNSPDGARRYVIAL